jgi:hypothetical protein
MKKGTSSAKEAPPCENIYKFIVTWVALKK